MVSGRKPIVWGKNPIVSGRNPTISGRNAVIALAAGGAFALLYALGVLDKRVFLR
jgi:hypothetical protein